MKLLNLHRLGSLDQVAALNALGVGRESLEVGRLDRKHGSRTLAGRHQRFKTVQVAVRKAGTERREGRGTARLRVAY